MALQVRGVKDQQNRVGCSDSGHPSSEDVTGDLLVFGSGAEAVDARQVNQIDFTRTAEARAADVLFDGYTREVCYFLPESGEAVEEGGLAAVGRADKRNCVSFGEERGRDGGGNGAAVA